MTNKRFNTNPRSSTTRSKAAGRVGGVPDGAVAKAPKTTPRKKGVDTTNPPVVTSSPVVAPHGAVAPETSTSNGSPAIGQQTQEKNTMATLVKDNKERKGHNGKAAHYRLDGVRGSVKISSTLFANGAPDTLEINWPVAGPSTPKVKMTKEERAAARAAMTPAQKLAEQEARLAKQQANLEARKAKLASAAA